MEPIRNEQINSPQEPYEVYLLEMQDFNQRPLTFHEWLHPKGDYHA